MNGFEKAVVALTALFFLLCAAILLLQTSAPAVTGDGCTVYAASESCAASGTIREKLDKVLGAASSGNPEGRININTASAEELSSLPGIGKTLAARIVRYRTYNGAFEDAAYLCDVTGIGEGLYAGLSDLIYAGT